MREHLPLFAALWLLLWSVILFVTMGADKRRARRAAFRVPEKTLFLLALLGGAPGGLLGMELFRHKTRHWTFVWGFRILTLLQLAGLLWLLSGQ
jgi:uncharacterized membrane protein YsdA (DUF1294 family)